MRLHGVEAGTVVATEGREVLVGDDPQGLSRVGRLPLPLGPRDRAVYGLFTSRRLRGLVNRAIGAVTAVNVWPLEDSRLLATVGRQLAVSADGGRQWDRAGRLPPSSGPMGVLPPAVTHADGVTYLGEYPLATDATPRILSSRDFGRSWRVTAALPDVRHIHAVQRDPYTGDIWVTTGDTDDEARIGRLRDDGVAVVGGGSQAWRAVELAFTSDAVLWGMDCPYATEQRIYQLPRDEIGVEDPSPVRVHALPGSAYYAAASTVDGDRWVAFSTGLEAGRDSTGPVDQGATADRGVVVASSSATGFREWVEVASFRRRRCLGDRIPGLPRANGYVFLADDDHHGLLINPYNTASGHGTVDVLPPGDLVGLVDGDRRRSPAR